MVSSGAMDAVVLAYAGLARLSRVDEVTEVLDPLQMLPAPAQGALAIECRAADDATATLLAPLDHADTRAVITAERSVAKFTACRTLTLSNGAAWVFSAM